MAVPRTRTSNARKNNRRSHHAKTPKQFAKCTNCSSACLPHTLCLRCGHYGGRAVVSTKKDGE